MTQAVVATCVLLVNAGAVGAVNTPLTLRVEFMPTAPLTFKLPLIPTPPATTNAPLVYAVEFGSLLTDTGVVCPVPAAFIYWNLVN